MKNPSFVQRWRISVCGRDSTLRATTRHVGLTLSLYANAEGENAYPSEDALAAACALSTRAVRTALSELEANGRIKREKRIGQGQAWRWHVYTLLLPEGAERSSLPNRKGAERSSLPNRKGAERSSPPSALHGEELNSGPNAEGPERASKRTGTTFQKGPEPRSADLEEDKQTSKSNLDVLTNDGVAVWQRGIALLTERGEPERNARSIIGKLRQFLKNNDARLLTLIAEAEKQAEPVGWLMAAAARRRPRSPVAGRISDKDFGTGSTDADIDRILGVAA
jgi:hypothetical protein